MIRHITSSPQGRLHCYAFKIHSSFWFPTYISYMHVDLLGSLPTSGDGHQNLLTIIGSSMSYRLRLRPPPWAKHFVPGWWQCLTCQIQLQQTRVHFWLLPEGQVVHCAARWIRTTFSSQLSISRLMVCWSKYNTPALRARASWAAGCSHLSLVILGLLYVLHLRRLEVSWVEMVLRASLHPHGERFSVSFAARAHAPS